MKWRNFIIDASMGAPDGVLCFCPVEMDAAGNVTDIITGMSYVGAPPEGTTVIGVFHKEGPDHASAFKQQHSALIAEFMP